MSPKNKRTQNEELIRLLKKQKTPAKRGLKKNTKEPIIEALNDDDNGKIQKPAPAAK
ncbi:8930_t:CDS:2 [Funneliformis geosporum]|nr:8930_t:CDS:2 [Funneliformis geosporum]